jgi:hypothetical protein
MLMLANASDAIAHRQACFHPRQKDHRDARQVDATLILAKSTDARGASVKGDSSALRPIRNSLFWRNYVTGT